jgi:hypothetical protein
MTINRVQRKRLPPLGEGQGIKEGFGVLRPGAALDWTRNLTPGPTRTFVVQFRLDPKRCQATALQSGNGLREYHYRMDRLLSTQEEMRNAKKGETASANLDHVMNRFRSCVSVRRNSLSYGQQTLYTIAHSHSRNRWVCY